MPKPVYAVITTYFYDDYKCRGDWSSTNIRLFRSNKKAENYACSIVIKKLEDYNKEEILLKADTMSWRLMKENIDEWFQGEFVPRRLGVEILETEID